MASHELGYQSGSAAVYSVQPEPIQSPFVIVSQPPPAQQQNVRQWSTGLCDCCQECCTCMYAFFCAPCFMCSMAKRMDECCLGPLCLGTPFVVPMRTKLRAMYGIQGNILNDCCVITFCGFCATTQMYRELNLLAPSK